MQQLMSDRGSLMSPLKVCFDDSAGGTLREVLLERPDLFVAAAADTADTVIFGTDAVNYIENNPLYRKYPQKSLAVSESDIPSFRIPGLYAANRRAFYARGRTRTISYFLSERERPNPEIKRIGSARIEKKYLYSFMGGANSWARKRLLRSVASRSDTLVEATDSYNHWACDADQAEARSMQQRRYAEVMAASRYALCPRGCGLSSYRLFESMSLGVAPVIIADRWQPIAEIDWSFALRLPEARIATLDRFVRSHDSEWEQRGAAARDTYLKTLSPEMVPLQLSAQIACLLADYRPSREAILHHLTRGRASGREVYWRAYAKFKLVALNAFQLSGLPFPFQLHQPLEQQLMRGKAPTPRER